MLYIVPVKRPPRIKLGPVGRCIYCGKGPPECELEREHVLADGLGGNVELVDASCRLCAEQKIHDFETTVIKNNFGLVRAAKGVKSQKNRGRGSKEKTDFWMRKSGGGSIRIPISPEMPYASILHHFGKFNRATILTGEDPRTREPDIWINGWDTLLPRMTGSSFELPAVNALYFFRFLAKTAHCAAYCLCPSGAFKPYLPNIILEGSADYVEAATYIGTIDEIVQPSAEGTPPEKQIMHSVEVDWVETHAYLPLLAGVRKRLLIAKINLFVNHFSHPTYEVVVGEESAEH